MDIIKTGIGISKTIRNVSRLREIVLVFAKHGFDEFISFGITSKIPNFVLPKSRKSITEELEEKEEKDWWQILGYRLRLCFEELGPAFVKFGQLLSSREDIFDQSFITEMKILRDKVRPVPFGQVVKVIEEDLGRKIEDVFKEIDEKPIGTASVGVVHRGVLKDGKEVVIKVKRPGIEKMVTTDFSILFFLVSQVEKVSEEVRLLGISRIVSDFGVSLQSELNFNVEALNCQRFKENLKKHDKGGLLYIPKIYEKYTTSNVLVMECLKGIPFSDQQALEEHKKDLSEKLDDGLKIFMKTFLNDGYFHADLHGGNFFYLENGKIGLIDFGLMGTLSKKSRKSFITIIYALITFNYENLVYEFLDVAEYETIPDVDILVNEVRDALSPYVGLTVQQIDFTIVLQSVISILKKHQIFLPREWFIVFRALMTLDGVGRSLGQDFDIYGILEEDIHEIIKETLSKDELIEEAIWAGKDIISSARLFPRHLKWFIKDLAKKGYSPEITLRGYEKHLSQVSSSVEFLAFSILAGIFIFSGVLLLQSKPSASIKNIPTLAWLFWGMGLISFIRGWLRLKIN